MTVTVSYCGEPFSLAATEKLVRIGGMVDGSKYRQILEENLSQSAKDTGTEVHLPGGQ